MPFNFFLTYPYFPLLDSQLLYSQPLLPQTSPNKFHSQLILLSVLELSYCTLNYPTLGYSSLSSLSLTYPFSIILFSATYTLNHSTRSCYCSQLPCSLSRVPYVYHIKPILLYVYIYICPLFLTFSL